MPENPIPELPTTHVVGRQPVDNNRNCTLRKSMLQRADRLLFGPQIQLLFVRAFARDGISSLKSPLGERNRSVVRLGKPRPSGTSAFGAPQRRGFSRQNPHQYSEHTHRWHTAFFATLSPARKAVAAEPFTISASVPSAVFRFVALRLSGHASGRSKAVESRWAARNEIEPRPIDRAAASHSRVVKERNLLSLSGWPYVQSEPSARTASTHGRRTSRSAARG